VKTVSKQVLATALRFATTKMNRPLKWYIDRRIAVDLTYSTSEALYATLEDYIEVKERNWKEAKERADLIISRLAGGDNELSND
jgi:hypothetical protein